MKIEKMPRPYRGYDGYAISVKLKDFKGNGFDDIADASCAIGIPVLIRYKKALLVLLDKDVCTKLFGTDATEAMFAAADENEE